ncbi:hypothetical protein [Rubritalea tangerina]
MPRSLYTPSSNEKHAFLKLLTTLQEIKNAASPAQGTRRMNAKF